MLEMTIRGLKIKYTVCQVHKLQYMHEKVNTTKSLIAKKTRIRGGRRIGCRMKDVKTGQIFIFKKRNKLKGTTN